MKRYAFPLLLLLVAALPAMAANKDDCLACHREKTPGAVRLWETSAHAAAKVGCVACHGSYHEKIEKGEARVTAQVCGKCHEKALREHTASRHGMGLHSGWGCTRNLASRDKRECSFCHEEGSALPRSTVHCARFLKQSSEMGEAGCNRCHSVESSCASCHSSHATDLKIVRDPAVCAKCHMGPDHPQWEMWQTSQHGTLFASQGEGTGPSCQACHMPSGSHDVTRGITTTQAGTAVAPEAATKQRSAMLKVCTRCHAEGFSRRELERDDAIRDQSLALVKEAEEIIRDLYRRGLLDPMPAERPDHPLSGKQLVLDSQMLYEDTSHIERLFFKMKKYDLAKTFKGAYHQNPAYTHWYGNAELKMDLVDIKAEAARLKERKNPPAGKGQAARSVSEDVEEKLRLLKRELEDGVLTPEEYSRRKALELERFRDKTP